MCEFDPIAVLQVGNFVKVVTDFDEILEGSVYCHDVPLGVVILKLGERGNKEDLSILRIDAMKYAEVLRDAPANFTPPTLHPIDPVVVEKRMQTAIERRSKELMHIGPNVTMAARKIFDMLSKTMECEWRGDTILVMGSVEVFKPYGVDNCQGANHFELNRVRHVMNQELQHLDLQKRRQSSPVN
eukprot:148739_1